MQLTLTIINEGGIEPWMAQHTFDEKGGVIGRNEHCDWVIPDPTHVVSSRHAEISYNGRGFIITDISTNGVYVNSTDAPLGRGFSSPIQDGDNVYIGNFVISVENSKAARAPQNDHRAGGGHPQAAPSFGRAGQQQGHPARNSGGGSPAGYEAQNNFVLPPDVDFLSGSQGDYYTDFNAPPNATNGRHGAQQDYRNHANTGMREAPQSYPQPYGQNHPPMGFPASAAAPMQPSYPMNGGYGQQQPMGPQGYPNGQPVYGMPPVAQTMPYSEAGNQHWPQAGGYNPPPPQYGYPPVGDPSFAGQYPQAGYGVGNVPHQGAGGGYPPLGFGGSAPYPHPQNPAGLGPQVMANHVGGQHLPQQQMAPVQIPPLQTPQEVNLLSQGHPLQEGQAANDGTHQKNTASSSSNDKVLAFWNGVGFTMGDVASLPPESALRACGKALRASVVVLNMLSNQDDEVGIGIFSKTLPDPRMAILSALSEGDFGFETMIIEMADQIRHGHDDAVSAWNDILSAMLDEFDPESVLEKCHRLYNDTSETPKVEVSEEQIKAAAWDLIVERFGVFAGALGRNRSEVKANRREQNRREKGRRRAHGMDDEFSDSSSSSKGFLPEWNFSQSSTGSKKSMIPDDLSLVHDHV